MPHLIEPCMDGKVIVGRVWGESDLDEYRLFSHEINNTLKSIPSDNVHLIWDVTEITGYATNIIGLREASVWVNSLNLGWTVCISNDPLFATMVQLIMTVNQKPLHRVSTSEEAYAFLQQNDPDLSISSSIPVE